jgi:hypothetical protein
MLTAFYSQHVSPFSSCLAGWPLQLLPEDTPAKCGGAPGNAFELVYASMTDAVRQKISSADPALGEWIRQAAAPCLLFLFVTTGALFASRFFVIECGT